MSACGVIGILWYAADAIQLQEQLEWMGHELGTARATRRLSKHKLC